VCVCVCVCVCVLALRAKTGSLSVRAKTGSLTGSSAEKAKNCAEKEKINSALRKAVGSACGYNFCTDRCECAADRYEFALQHSNLCCTQGGRLVATIFAR